VKGGYIKTAGTRDVVIKKDGASQLERQENKYLSAGISKNGTKHVTLHVVNNHKKRKELDGTYSEITKFVEGCDEGEDGW